MVLQGDLVHLQVYGIQNHNLTPAIKHRYDWWWKWSSSNKNKDSKNIQNTQSEILLHNEEFFSYKLSDDAKYQKVMVSIARKGQFQIYFISKHQIFIPWQCSSYSV